MAANYPKGGKRQSQSSMFACWEKDQILIVQAEVIADIVRRRDVRA